MKIHLTVISVAFLTASLFAQSKYNIIPRGVDLIELSRASSIALNWSNGNTTRIQQADTAHTGNLRVLKSIAWRRDSNTARGTTWTATLDIYLGHSDISKFSTTFATNHLSTPTKVFGGSMKLDWTKPSPLPVGLWSDATFPFKAPFVYNGRNALLWETQTTSTATTSSGYAVDWSSSFPATRTSLIPQVLGTGCTTGNGAMSLATSFTVDSTPAYTSRWDVTNASSSVPVSVHIGLLNPDIPFLCGRLHTDALVSMPLGTSSAGGVATFTANAPWQTSMAGLGLMTQALAIDNAAPGGGYLSNGIFLCLPKAVGYAPFAVKRIYSTASSTAAYASGSVTSSCQPTQFK